MTFRFGQKAKSQEQKLPAWRQAISWTTWGSCVLLTALTACSPSVRAAGYSLSSGNNETSPPPENNAASSQQLQQEQGENSPPAPSALPAPQIPDGGRVIGESGGIALEALSPSAHWVSYCQHADNAEEARDMPTNIRGDALEEVALFLQVGESSEKVDALLRYSDDGRYLVVLIEQKAWLIDALKNKRWELSELAPDLRSDPLADHRSFAFTHDSLAVISHSEEVAGYLLPLNQLGPQTPLLELARPVLIEDREIFRLQAGESHLSAQTLAQGSSEKSWPTAFAKQPTHRCHGHSRSYDAFPRLSSYRPDPQIFTAWLPLPKGWEKKKEHQLQDAPGFVMANGDSWVRRLDSGRLMLVRGKSQKQLTSENCGSRILHGYGPSDLFLIACEEYEPVIQKKKSSRHKKPKYRFDLYLVRPGYVRSLKADVARTGVDVLGQRSDRYVPIRPGAEAALVDFKSSQLIHLPGETQVLALGSAGVLLLRNNKLSLWTAPAAEEKLDLEFSALAPIRVSGPTIALGKQVLQLLGTLQSWTLPSAPLALTHKGHALVASEAGNEARWPRGPLVLLSPPLLQQPSSQHKQTQPITPPGESEAEQAQTAQPAP